MNSFAKYANMYDTLISALPRPFFRSLGRILRIFPLAALVALATCPDAWATSTAVLIDFGTSEEQNSFEIPGWDTAILDTYTDYADIGPGGTTIVVGDNSAYNFQGVTGSGRFFAEGDTVRAYWYNNSGQSISFAPNVSFNDPDRRISGAAGDWNDMGTANIGPYSSGSTDYVLTADDSGIYDLVNLCANYDNNQTLVCDKIELIAIDGPWTATVDKTGDGDGVVSSSPAGLDCGGTCGVEFFPGTMVELSATPASGSIFSGWSGESCEGEQTCRLTMTSDKTVEAEFTGGAPIAAFSADLTIGEAPLTVTFTDASGNAPDTWQWDFDNDGTVDSTLQNPSFQYEEPGVYTVELTVANAVGTDTKTKKHYITTMNPSAGTVYEIGPGKTYESTRDVGLHLLQEGDVVRIDAKPNRAPYVEKFIVAGVGTEENPIRVVGIPDDEGNKPIFYGYNAQDNTDYGNYYWNEDRQIVLIGQHGSKQAEHIVVEGLEVHGAVYGDPFVNDSGQNSYYASNAAGIRISTGTAVVRDCDVHGNENGIFASNTGDSVLEYCHIHDNGAHASSYLQHNIYYGGSDTSGSEITVQYCHIGELLNDGQQAKFRAETLVFRYNWVEGGKNSVLDLVEEANNGVSDAYVYGNILIKPAFANNGRMIHFGGDNPSADRSGTLYFFNNTCIVKTVNRDATLFQIDEADAYVVADNNVFFQSGGGTNHVYLCGSDQQDKITGANNWFADGTLDTDPLSDSLFGTDPGFVDADDDDYRPKYQAAVEDIVQSFSFPSGHELNAQYVKHLARESRPADGALDLGAYEFVGQDLYVESSGQCGQCSPCFALVSDALAYATGGEVIKVAGGVYAENVEIGKDVIVEFGLNSNFSMESPFEPAILTNPFRAAGRRATGLACR